MTSITAQTHATLDGVIDAPPADALLPYMSDAGRQGALDLALAADALLLARETWQGLARAWRDQTGPMAERLNAMPKYVVSATLGSADEWDHTTIVGYDDIAGLREREQLLTYGCGRLARDCWPTGCSTCSCCRSRPSWRAPAGGCSTTPATSSGCGSPTARPSRPAPCGCSLSRITPDRSYNRVPLSKRGGTVPAKSSPCALQATSLFSHGSVLAHYNNMVAVVVEVQLAESSASAVAEHFGSSSNALRAPALKKRQKPCKRAI